MFGWEHTGVCSCRFKFFGEGGWIGGGAEVEELNGD
jgi:hypothetical protein